MGFDGGWVDAEGLADRFVGAALDEMEEDFGLAGGETNRHKGCLGEVNRGGGADAADLLKLGQMGLELLGVGSVLVGSIDMRLKGCFSIGEFCGEKMFGIVQERRESISIVQVSAVF